MTLTLSPEIEARLRERAAREGKEIHQVAQTLLSDALFDEAGDLNEDDLSEAEIATIQAGIKRGLEAAAQGRERLFSDYVSDVHKRRDERRADASR